MLFRSPARQTYAQWRQSQFGNITSPDGEPSVDADGDGALNSAEFLAATNPLQGSSVFRITPERNGNDFTFQFTLPDNRSFFIEESADLTSWHLLDAPENNGVPRTAGSISISIPLGGGQGFYRARLADN